MAANIWRLRCVWSFPAALEARSRPPPAAPLASSTHEALRSSLGSCQSGRGCAQQTCLRRSQKIKDRGDHTTVAVSVALSHLSRHSVPESRPAPPDATTASMMGRCAVWPTTRALRQHIRGRQLLHCAHFARPCARKIASRGEQQCCCCHKPRGHPPWHGTGSITAAAKYSLRRLVAGGRAVDCAA